MVDRCDRSYPAILTAGDKGRARPIYGSNKALLELAGAPVFTHVLASLEQSASVRAIHLVGPKASLEAALQRTDIPFRGTKPVRIFEQWSSLYLNIWNTFQAIVNEEPPGGDASDFTVLVVPSDVPLVVPEEIDEFVNACDMGRFDYAVGISSERVLSRYYPQRHRRGIRPLYFHMKEGSFRQNNLHLVKPARMENRIYIQRAYDYRLQRQWGHIVRLLWEIFRTQEGTLRMVGQYLLLHLATLLYRVPWLSLHRAPASLVRKGQLEKSCSSLMRTRFTAVETHYGGAALDIDTPEHYRVIQENFEAWKRMQRDEVSGALEGHCAMGQ
jgi:GTP:adenosylcobinamide-phosphate guanylyltransferase